MDNVVEQPVVESSAPTTPPVADKPNKVSPAQDLRDIQYLLLNGIFPGNVAPAVVKAYNLIDNMAKTVEAAGESK